MIDRKLNRRTTSFTPAQWLALGEGIGTNIELAIDVGIETLTATADKLEGHFAAREWWMLAGCLEQIGINMEASYINYAALWQAIKHEDAVLAFSKKYCVDMGQLEERLMALSKLELQAVIFLLRFYWHRKKEWNIKPKDQWWTRVYRTDKTTATYHK